MYRMSQITNLWPRRSAVIITKASGNFGMLVKELLRNFHWTVAEITPSPATALTKIKQAQANLVIIDDSVEQPSSYVLRSLFSSPYGPVTPILAFFNENNKTEYNILRGIGKTVLTPKPLTPGKFQVSFEQLIKQWSEGYFLALREVLTHITESNEKHAIETLQKLNQYSGAQALVSPCLAMLLVKREQLKEAEKLLLRDLKQRPRDLGVIIPLIDIYLEHAMPELAYRILKSVQDAFNDSLAFTPDIIQAMIQSDRIQEASTRAENLVDSHFLSLDSTSYQAKILFAHGSSSSLRLLNRQPSVFEAIKNTWNRHSKIVVRDVKAS